MLLGALLRRYVEGDVEGFQVRSKIGLAGVLCGSCWRFLRAMWRASR